MKKGVVFLLVLCTLVFAGCGNKTPEKITLKIGDPHPNRENGVGAILERINAEFKAAHPNVEIITESYQDQPWQEMVKIYASSNQLPDIMKYWTFPGMMLPLINAGLLEPLNKSDFTGFEFMPGALEGSEYNGKLYGIPASADLWVLFVNRGLFERAGVPLPKSWEDIMAAVPKFNAIGITSVVTNGKEGWPLCIFFDNIAQRINGDFTRLHNAVSRSGSVKFTDSDFVQAAAYIQNLVKAGVFNGNLTDSDYGSARNQFGREQAAMYMIGAWEMSLATDTTFSNEFRSSLDVIKFPITRNGKGIAEDTMAWFGGNFIIANSKNKELAALYLKLLAEKFAVYEWETGAAFPAQKVTPRPSDTDVSKKLLQIASEITSTSGIAGNDRSTQVFKEEYEELARQLFDLVISPEEFCSKLDAAAETAVKDL